MTFYLVVTKNEGDPKPETFKFIQHAITIGEDVSNNLRLIGGEKSISPIHAEILSKNGKYYLIDYGSKEGVFIDNLKLKQKQSYLLHEGCTFEVGRYSLRFTLMGNEFKAHQTKKNSLQMAINHLADSLAYLDQARQGRAKQNDTILAQKLAENLEERQIESLKRLVEVIVPAKNNMQNLSAFSNHENSDFISDMFFKLFVDVFEVSVNISHTFIDPKTVHRKDSKQLLSSENLKHYLFEENLSPQERDKRRAFLSAEVDDLISRQTAIFTGYQNSIKYGIKDLLREFDPATILKHGRGKTLHIGPLNISKKIIPFLTDRKAIRDIINTYQVISKQNQKEMEQKYFHPAFISGYLSYINSSQRQPK